MNIKRRIIIIASIACFLIETHGADNYTDGNRPYEFGFSIEGEQHRHEKKDEKGIIQGEFGFITADGVYHVTVYATDEEGRFKILSMKNIRVKPYPTYTAKQSNTSARQGHSLELTKLQATVPTAGTTTTIKSISIGPPANSCSHCSLPTTSTPAPIVSPFNQPSNNGRNQIGEAGSPKFPQGVKPQPTFISQPEDAIISPQQGFGRKTPQQSDAQNYPTQPQNSLSEPQIPLEQGLVPPQNPQNLPQSGFGSGQNLPTGINSPQGNLQGPGSSNPFQSSKTPVFPQQQPQILENSPAGPQSSYPGGSIGQNFPSSISRSQGPSDTEYPVEKSEPARESFASGRTPKRLEDIPSFGSVGTQPNSLQRSSPNSQAVPAFPTKPTLISAQMQIVDKNTDIYRRDPGENEGLPKGLTKDDMTRLLYTFNYTVGFHGHFEEGFTNGVKQGYYFIVGRNGVRTRVDYVADSKGFRPKISQEVLDLLSDDVPKPESEKEEKYGLKGYEFKWLYYPVEVKGR